MSNPAKKETQFTERMANYGFLFLISGLLTFFGLQNYAPFSFFAFEEPMNLNETSFFFADFSWCVIVLLYLLIPLSIASRFIYINKEIQNSKYKLFSIFYFVSVMLQFLSVLLIFVVSFVPSYYFPNITAIGMVYLSVNTIVQVFQIIAWLIFYNLSRKRDTELGKEMEMNFGGVPIIFIIGNFIALGSYAISYVSSSFILSGNPIFFPNALMLAKLGTYVFFGWIGFTMLGNIIAGIRILNKPKEKTAKSFASQRLKVKKVKQSCPVCRDNIYEGQNICSNCGYRI
jgi:hypothetical protein